MRSLISVSTCLLFLTSSVAASPVIDERAASDSCQFPQAKPLIKSIANNFPKAAVNSFCTSVLGAKNVPKTTVTREVATITKRLTETVTDTYTATTTKCVTSLAKRDPFPTPMPEGVQARAPPPLQRDAQGRLFGFPKSIVSEACKCVVAPVTVVAKVTATEIYHDYIFTVSLVLSITTRSTIGDDSNLTYHFLRLPPKP